MRAPTEKLVLGTAQFGLNYGINILFYHHFDDLKNYKNVFQELKKLRLEKLINKIGVSVYNNIDLNEAIETEEMDCIQLPFNLLDNYHQRGEFLKKAKVRNKEV